MHHDDHAKKQGSMQSSWHDQGHVSPKSWYDHGEIMAWQPCCSNPGGRIGLCIFFEFFLIASFHGYYDGPYAPSCTAPQLCYNLKKIDNFHISHKIPYFGRGRKMSYGKA